jgi:threonyl-tRNA synthetase
MILCVDLILSHQHYKADMFTFTDGGVVGSTCDHGSCGSDSAHSDSGNEFGLKPMNCPGHCIMFKSVTRSYRDLPLRFAEFSPLHRNEIAGSLSGLTRVRRFAQDDAHIFCGREHIEKEIKQCLEMMRTIYNHVNFTFSLRLSTRPSSCVPQNDFSNYAFRFCEHVCRYMGELADWDAAEAALAAALDNSGASWVRNEGDGAFYGPKIDVTITGIVSSQSFLAFIFSRLNSIADALGRHHQCGTIQLDFQLPRKFGLEFTSADGSRQTPVIIHRAILGSLERFMALLLENTGGFLPFGVAPRHVAVLPVSAAHAVYAQCVVTELQQKCPGAYVELMDSSSSSLGKRVRECVKSRVSMIWTVGDDEVAGRSVSMRWSKSSDTSVLLISSTFYLQRFCRHSLPFYAKSGTQTC